MLQFISSSNEVALIVWLNYLYISSLKNKVFFEKMNASVVREQKTSVSTALLDTHVNNPQELLRCSFHPDDSNYLPNIIYTAICKKEVHLPFSSLISDPSFESAVLPCHLLQNTSFKNVFFFYCISINYAKTKASELVKSDCSFSLTNIFMPLSFTDFITIPSFDIEIGWMNLGLTLNFLTLYLLLNLASEYYLVSSAKLFHIWII